MPPAHCRVFEKHPAVPTGRAYDGFCAGGVSAPPATPGKPPGPGVPLGRIHPRHHIKLPIKGLRRALGNHLTQTICRRNPLMEFKAQQSLPGNVFVPKRCCTAQPGFQQAHGLPLPGQGKVFLADWANAGPVLNLTAERAPGRKQQIQQCSPNTHRAVLRRGYGAGSSVRPTR